MPAIISSVTAPWPIILAALGGGLLLAAAFGLWAFFGTAVFFEMVRTGSVAMSRGSEALISVGVDGLAYHLAEVA